MVDQGEKLCGLFLIFAVQQQTCIWSCDHFLSLFKNIQYYQLTMQHPDRLNDGEHVTVHMTEVNEGSVHTSVVRAVEFRSFCQPLITALIN